MTAPLTPPCYGDLLGRREEGIPPAEGACRALAGAGLEDRYFSFAVKE